MNNNLRIVSSSWYTYPNCATVYDSYYKDEQKVLIGIVTVVDRETKETKRYIGVGDGRNQRDDELKILEIGIPFYGTV